MNLKCQMMGHNDGLPKGPFMYCGSQRTWICTRCGRKTTMGSGSPRDYVPPMTTERRAWLDQIQAEEKRLSEDEIPL